MFNLFNKKSQKNTTGSKNSEEQFWKWFVDNKSKIQQFIDSNARDYTIYKNLTEQMKKYNELLFPELTKTKDNKYVMIITPDGMHDGVEPTQKLGESHPELNDWLIKKFRQPTDEITLNINDLEYPSTDIEIIPEIDREKDKVDIHILIRNMNKDEMKYKHLAFLYLDHILGEFNTITKVGYIEFYDSDEAQTPQGRISILELRKLIEKELY